MVHLGFESNSKKIRTKDNPKLSIVWNIKKHKLFLSIFISMPESTYSFNNERITIKTIKHFIYMV